MVSERGQTNRVLNPLLNPLEFWQNYLVNWIQANRGFYENAIKVNEYWFKAFCEPWLRSAVAEQKERWDK
jgi:hypothetical protein